MYFELKELLVCYVLVKSSGAYIRGKRESFEYTVGGGRGGAVILFLVDAKYHGGRLAYSIVPP